MRSQPSILRRPPIRTAVLPGGTPVNRLMEGPRSGSILGTFQLRTQSVVDYLAATLRKTW